MKRGTRDPRNTRWCALHRAHYPAWADAQKTKLGKCFECADEEKRATAAAGRRAAKAAEHE